MAYMYMYNLHVKADSSTRYEIAPCFWIEQMQHDVIKRMIVILCVLEH